MSFWISLSFVLLGFTPHNHQKNECECERAIKIHRLTGTSLSKMAANSDNLIITEIMQNPNAVADTSGEWFEVFNPGNTQVNMNGWTLKDNGTDSHTITTDVFVPARGYAVLGKNSNVATNGGIVVNYQYTSLSLANGADEIILVRPDSTIANQVAYTGASPWPDPTGASMELSSASADNSIATNWAEATEVMPSGDKGTPGTGPDAVESLLITEIMQNPVAVSDTNGEWFEIHNAGAVSINLNGWTLKDSGSDVHMILTDLWVPAGGYVVLGNDANTGTNGGVPVDYQYSGFTLSNSADEIILERPDNTIANQISYTGVSPWPNPTGASMELNAIALDNSLGSNWSTATTQMSNGDFGTPGIGPGGGQPGGNQAPVIEAGSGRTLYLETTDVATLFSASAADPDGDTLTSQWSLTAGNAVDVTISSPTSLQTQVTFRAIGTFTFELVVSDGALSAADTLVVIVAERPVFNGDYQIYFGNLHAHSAYSDGNKGNDPTYNNVAESFRYARDFGGMDWLLMADHNHATAGMALADYHSGVNETNLVNAESGLFSAIYGMEWGTISAGGHVIMASDSLWGWEPANYDILTPKGDYNSVFQQINTIAGFGSLCHPNSSDFSNIFNSAYNASWDNAVSMVAIKSGPAFATVTDYSDPSNSSYLSFYHNLLLKGYHVAPGSDQDTHYANWGLANEQRTAVLAVENTPSSILEALTAGRCYAVEDRNIQLTYTATYNGQANIMSSILAVPVGNAVQFDLQAVDSDGETITSVELFQGVIGGSTVNLIASSSNSVLQYNFTPQTQGETSFFYMTATEEDGQRAWSAPIWVEGTTGGPTNQAPTADFSSSVTNLSVAFTDLSTDNDGSIAQRNWNFGDGTSSTVQNPNHTYATAGIFSVTLTVTDNQGKTGSRSRNVTVTAPNTAPIANFNFSTANLAAAFTDLSTDSDGTVTQWNWNFGDGTSTSTQNPNHTFATAGTYTVTLTVSDNQAATGTLARSVTVTAANLAPTANFGFSTANLAAAFSDLSTDSDGTVTQWNWNFGDGTSAATQNPNHTYATAGTYTVTLTVTDNQAATGTLARSVTVTAANLAPTAEFSFTSNNLTAAFTDLSTDSDGSITARSWDFGDGSTSSSAYPSHTYTAAGSYTVSLSVTDNGGLNNSISHIVTVTEAPTGNVLQNGVAVPNLSGALHASTFYTITVPAGATNLVFSMSGGSGDADLYVTLGSDPTTSSYGYRSWNTGNTETITIASPSAGTYHVLIYAYAAYSGASRTASSVEPGTGGGGHITETQTGSLAGKASKYYTINVSGGTIDLSAVWTGSRDIDLYLYNPSGTQVKSATSSSQPEVLSYNTNGVSGAWQVRVYNYSRSTTNYTLTLNYEQP